MDDLSLCLPRVFQFLNTIDDDLELAIDLGYFPIQLVKLIECAVTL